MIKILMMCAILMAAIGARAEYTDDCITFSSAEAFTLKTYYGEKNWDGTLWTSTDKINWTEWDGTTVSAAQTGGTYVLYVRGNTSNTMIAGYSVEVPSPFRWVLTGSSIACTGNIETLRGATGNQPSPTTMASYCYYGMFHGCTALTKAPALPATTLAKYCYSYMFSDCMALTEAPALPATTLAKHCYSDMFNGCTALTNAPTLPATTLADSCYWCMFKGCSSLTEAPALPAMTLAWQCYCGMFYGCTALTVAPALTATTLAGECYYGMFRGCTSLTDAPELPATTLEYWCYREMFYGCTALIDAPALPAKTLADGCYYEMFRDCIALTNAPELPATTLADDCYDAMFYGCTSLTNAPALPATTLARSCYSDMFSGCTSLTNAPALPATTLAGGCYGHMFCGCTSLTDAPALPATTLVDYCYYYMFYGCTALEVNTVGPGKEWKIPATSTTASNWGTDMFTDTNGSLQGRPALNTTYYIRSALPPTPTDDCITFSSANAFTLSAYWGKTWDGMLWTSTNKITWIVWRGGEVSAAKTGDTYFLYVRGNTANTKITGYDSGYERRYRWMLTGSNIACTGNIETLRGAIGNNPSPTKMSSACYSCMFKGCTALTAAPAMLPATTLAKHCYSDMFNGCTSLTNAPTLPATTLADSCYYEMFAGCTALTTAPALPATTLADSCYRGMFYGCRALKDAPALPATTLTDSCYRGMFEGCTALEVNKVAPGKKWKIPATGTTAPRWGDFMFYRTKGNVPDTPELNTTYYIKSAPLPPPGSRGNPWPIGAGEGDTVEAWTNGTTLVVQGAGKMMDFDAEDSVVPWPVEQIAAVEIASNVTSIGQNAWLGLDKSVKYNGLSAEAAKTMGNGFGGTTQYARTAFREFLVNGASISATVALETAKSLTNEWTEVELKASDVSVENGRIVIQHESVPQSQGFYLLQPTE